MTTRRMAVAAAVLLAVAVSALPHPGRTAKDGCHFCRTNCAKWNVKEDVRHCHGADPEPPSPPSPPVSCPAPTGEIWHGLVVAPECSCSDYDPDDYRYPQSVEPEIAARDGMVSRYTGRRFESLKESDIEHVVARSEAHDSGLCAASQTVRSRFSRDLDNLVLASPELNRHDKRAKDAAEWLPDLNRCWFAETIIAVRQEYSLTIDPHEVEALEAVLARCPSG